MSNEYSMQLNLSILTSMAKVRRSRVNRSDGWVGVTPPLCNEYDSQKGRDTVERLASANCLMGKPPFGVWYQVGDSWEEWCSRKELGWMGDYRMTFDVDHSRMLVLESWDDLLAFGELYGLPLSHSYINIVHAVDWSRVMSDYDGLEISRQFYFSILTNPELQWYWGWDVASGVCWNADKCISNINFEDRVTVES